jgi:hypothetical protein
MVPYSGPKQPPVVRAWSDSLERVYFVSTRRRRETGCRAEALDADGYRGTILLIAVVVGLAWRRHSAAARLRHPAAALQQTDPASGR